MTGRRERGGRAGRRGFRGGREKPPARGELPEKETEWLLGWHPVREALRAGSRPLGRILVAMERHDGRVAEVLRLARQAGVPVRRVPRDALRRILPPGVVHQGIAGEVSAKAYDDPRALLEGATSSSLFILLDEVQDPRNLGAVLRTAAAVSASGVFLPQDRSAGLTPAAARASAGGVETVPVARVGSLGRWLREMGRAGIHRVGLDPRANELFTAVPGSGAIALVVGNERRGLRPDVRAACDQLVRIPIPGAVDSLNVSVAAGIALYEILRARSRQCGSPTMRPGPSTIVDGGEDSQSSC